MQASVLGPLSVDGVRGGSLVHGSCTISPRLTRGCRVSGDGHSSINAANLCVDRSGRCRDNRSFGRRERVENKEEINKKHGHKRDRAT